MTTTTRTIPEGFDRAATLDTTRSYMGSLMSFLTLSSETGGCFALMEFQGKPGNEPPPHIHLWENEVCYVLEGAIDLYCGQKVMHVHADEAFFIPRGQPHAFYIRSAYFRALIMVQSVGKQPVGLDEFFTVMSAPATSMTLPDQAITYQREDPLRVAEVAARHGMKILSPEEATLALPQFPGFGQAPPLEAGLELAS